MKQKRMNFFKRAKNAVINFEEYNNFSEEKVSIAVKYLLKLVLIFTIIVTISLSVKLLEEANKFISIFRDEFPEFKFENNSLIIEEENKQFIKTDESGYLGIVLDSEKENITEIEEAKEYQMGIALLKDKIVVKSVNNMETVATYEEVSNNYNLAKISKQSILEAISSNYMKQAVIIIIAISILYLYIAYFIQILIDVLLLSLIGYILSKIVRVKFKYKAIFNMSVYALTLSIILYMIYIIVNLFTGFEIVYFDIAYDAIAYIYIITAMLMIKSDLIKQQIEIGKIVEEQKKVREEKQQEEDKEKQEQKEDKEKKKDNKENNNEEGTPEGSNA